MNCRFCLFVWLLLVGSASALDTHAGEISCAATSRAGACRLSWDMRAQPRAFYWVQALDARTQRWESLNDKPHERPVAQTRQPVREGHLYRVLGCDDAAGRRNCTSSGVFWVPVHPASADAIPDVVYDLNGQSMAIDKEASLEEQTQVYNVYLLVRLAETLDLASMPPMIEPPRIDLIRDPELGPDAFTHYDVFLNYMTLRHLARGEPALDATAWWRQPAAPVESSP